MLGRQNGGLFLPQPRGVIGACLGGVGVSLLLVGIVSGTFVRHLIQVLPTLLALVVVARRFRWAPYAALPVFALWLLLMLLIWLYLVGVQTFFTGTFTLAEVVLTAVIGLLSLLGILACIRSRVAVGAAVRAAVVTSFAALQIGALWVSFLRPFANG